MEPEQIDTANVKLPLVSVGVPTYNRPEGLRRTLSCLTAQTYPNLEIIVGDNGSAGDESERIAREFADKDPRIRYHRHAQNMGPGFNFKFVLREAKGDFFFWAADDDEWHPEFVEFCLANIGDSGSVMTDYSVKFRTSGRVTNHRLPVLEGGKGNPRDITAYLKFPQPTMFYGLHRREAILFFLEDDMFDWYDCYFCLRLISAHGFRTVNGPRLYTAGVDAENYVPKSVNGRFNPLPYFFKSFRYITTRNAVYNLSVQALTVWHSFNNFTLKRSTPVNSAGR
jgi:glycosyltransferase involved in cell wall biosynthesis